MQVLTHPMIIAGGEPNVRFWAGRDYCGGPRSWGVAVIWGLRAHCRLGERRYRHTLAIYFSIPRLIGGGVHLERY